MSKRGTKKNRYLSESVSAAPVDDLRGQIMGQFMAYENGDPNVLLDVNRAIHLEGMDVCRVDAFSGVTDKTNRTPNGPERHELISMVLEGRINKSPQRSKAMYIYDVDGAAALISELLALGSRMGPEFNKVLHERVEALLEGGHVGPQDPPQPVDSDMWPFLRATFASEKHAPRP